MYKEKVFVGNGYTIINNGNGDFVYGGRVGTSNSNKLVARKMRTIHFPPAILHQIKKISCKLSYQGLITSKDGRVFHFLSNKLANKRNKIDETAIELKFKSKVYEVFTGIETGFVLLENKDLFVFGKNHACQLGFESPLNTLTSQKNVLKATKLDYSTFLQPNESIIDIQGGVTHSVLLSSLGNVYSCGKGKYGQLGHGIIEKKKRSVSFFEKKFRKILFFVKKGIKIQQISVGTKHSMFLTTNNKVYAVGRNNCFQLGVHKKREDICPLLVESLQYEPISKIRTGSKSSFFFTKTNKIYICGDNRSFALGFKERKKRIVPTLLSSEFIDAFPATGHSFFVKSNGNVLSCGYNRHFECIQEGEKRNENYPWWFFVPIKIPKNVQMKRNGKISNIQIQLELKHSKDGNFKKLVFQKQISKSFSDCLIETVY